ncbi:MAG: septal ring lytic transglycosylase RlpA family protein [Hyphomicrobiaceae bacterium]
MHRTHLIRPTGADLWNAARAALTCAAFAGALAITAPASFAADAPTPQSWTALKSRSSIEQAPVRISAVERIVAPTDVTEVRRSMPQGVRLASLGDNQVALDNGAAGKAKAAKADQVGIASYYWQPQALASGGRFNPNAMTAAHKTLPFGTRVRIRHLRNGRSVDVHINDRGPYVGGRIIDLSKAAASKIGMTGQGVARVSMTVLGR